MEPTELDKLLLDLSDAATSSRISNGAVIFHILKSGTTSKFKKRDYGQTVEVLSHLIGEGGPDPGILKLKCKDVYNKYVSLKKNSNRLSTWRQLVQYLESVFHEGEKLVHHSQLPQTSTPKPSKRKTSLPSQVSSPQPSICTQPSPKKLKTDCPKCSLQRLTNVQTSLELKKVKSEKYLIQRSVADLKRAYKKKAVDQCRRRRKLRIRELKENVCSLKKRAELAEAANLRNKRKKTRLQRDNKLLQKQNTSLEAQLKKLKLKYKLLEREKNEMKRETILPSQQDSDSSSSLLETKTGKNYQDGIRLAVYFMLSRQVPVSACGPVLREAVEKVTGKKLTHVPSTSTSAQMAYELSIISAIQIGTHLMQQSRACLSWDATSVDGSHVNEIHLTTADGPLTLDVAVLPGGRAEDYAKHILSTFASIAAIFCKYRQDQVLTEASVLQKFHSAITCTLTDRAIVNSATVKLLEEALQQDLITLHCNVHPLDAFAKRCRDKLAEFDVQNSIKGKCFGKEGSAVNVIQAVSKLRFKAGSGDPEGFKTFLRENSLPLGTFVRYVGNRLHVLMHSAGVLQLHLSQLISFLKTTSTAAPRLRTALLSDLQDERIIQQVWALSVVGKFVSGPWMANFYSTTKSNLEMIPILQSSKARLQTWAGDPQSVVATTHKVDIFNAPIDTNDPVVQCIMQRQPGAVQFDILRALFSAILHVYDSQLARYTDGDLSSLSPAAQEKVKIAPAHNMQSERSLALLDGIWRRAPNATPGFLKGKVQCRLNKTLPWLHQQADKGNIIRFSISEGYKARQVAAMKDKEVLKVVGVRRKEVAQKRDRTRRVQVAKGVNKLLGGVGDDEQDISEDVRLLITSFLTDPDVVVGTLISHVWEEEDGADKVYFGRIRDVKKAKTGRHKLTITYWSPEQLEVDGEDYNVQVGDFFADMILGDLGLC